MVTITALPAAYARGKANIFNIRMARSRSRTRLVLDIDHSVQHTLFTLNKPQRVVIDIRDVLLDAGLPELIGDGPIKNIRSARRNSSDLRIVLELKAQAASKSFLLPPDGNHRHRLVVDLFDKSTNTVNQSDSGRAVKKLKESKPLRNIVVAIDAGHGGKDPGASGRNRTREKDITLAVAKRLKKALDKVHGIKPVLIRKRDVFVSLRERIRIARKHKADLFVSLHADAFHNIHASGASVYSLSTRGATSEAAQWLADKENAADLFGGVSIRNRTDVVAEILLDLAQSATIQSSLDVGSVVLKNLGKVGKVHKRKVEQAGFAVLKSPDIPSILIETAFISNPSEERKLRTKGYQEKLARAIAKGISQYFKKQSPPGTILSGRSKLKVS